MINKQNVRDRIEYLLNNSDLATADLGKRERNDGRKSYHPNCHGTVIFSLQKEGIINLMNTEGYRTPKFLQNGLGWIDGLIMANFLREYCTETKPDNSEIVSFWAERKDNIPVLQHTGIFVPWMFEGNQEQIFNQLNTGGKFCFININEYKTGLEREVPEMGFIINNSVIRMKPGVRINYHCIK